MINTPVAKSLNASNPIVEIDVEKLDTLLADLEQEHEQLLTLAGLQRDAISRADTKELSRVVEQTAGVMNRIAGIENTRQKAIKLPDGSIPTIDQIVSQVNKHHADKLTKRSHSLRTLIAKVNQEHNAVKEASQALSNHMNGLMEQVKSKLSHSGTYSHRGAINPGRSQVVSSLDTVR